MADEETSFSLIWQEHEITVSYETNWLNTEYWHVELRCTERLPVIETDYRSRLVPAAEIDDAAEVEAFVIAWLNAAATDKAWLKYLQDRRQLNLF